MALRVQGGQEWASGRRKETVGLGAASIPASVRARDRTPLETARAALALTASPGPMPCREAERAEISRFIEEAVAAGGRRPPPPFIIKQLHPHPMRTCTQIQRRAKLHALDGTGSDDVLSVCR